MLAQQPLRWEWRLKSEPEALWPFVSDTNRFNFDRGNLPLRVGPRLQNARRELNLGGQQYTEEPYEWARPSYFAVRRVFAAGDRAFKQLNLRGELQPLPHGGTLFSYTFWPTPTNSPSAALMPLILRSQYAAFDRAIRNYDRVAILPHPSPFALSGKVNFTPGGRERLAALRNQLIADGADAFLVARLVDIIQNANEVSAARLRPYQLADIWTADRRAVLELCLWAVHIGLLEFHWEALCPLCRTPRQSTTSLGQIKEHVHCDSCNIDATAAFDRSVELTFRPVPTIRNLDVGEFCVGSPQLTPHIVAQQLLAPGETRDLRLPLEVGRYRLRALELPGGQFLIADEDGVTGLTLTANPEGWTNYEFLVSTAPVFRLRNDTDAEQLLILERVAWDDQAAAAADVTALQLFRDLFASEALPAGERMSVGSLTILFTNLRGSTQLYREVGDAAAFGRVLSHFDILRRSISAERGALVKTIGDSVMAVFARPAGALRAILNAQHELAHPPGGLPPLRLKAGVHAGPCIAVTLNGRLDYFGAVVNVAARLEGQTPEGGIAISSVVYQDPEVQAYVAEVKDSIYLESFHSQLKDIGDTPLDLWRVSLKPVGKDMPAR